MTKAKELSELGSVLTVAGNGFIGIGTSNPSKKLEVGALGVFRLQTGASTLDCTPTAGAIDGFVWNTSANCYYDWSTGSSSRMRIDNAGNVGIGTNSPIYRLDVVAADTTPFGYGARLRGNSGYDAATLQFTNNGGTVEQGVVYAGASEMSIRTYDTRFLSIYTAANERARFGSNGGFAIGGTGTDASLHIQQSYGGYDRLTQISPAGTTKNAFNIMAAKNGSGGDIWWSWGVRTDNVWCFQPGVNYSMNSATGIYFDSAAAAYKPGGGTWTSTSDARVKTNITPITDAATRIMALKPSSFDYKAPEAHAGRVSDRGFIAQEFELVYPHSVSESSMISDAEQSFFVEGDTIKALGLNPDFFADLVALVQEQQTTIEDLRSRLAALEAK